jgi:hypothetical protein
VGRTDGAIAEALSSGMTNEIPRVKSPKHSSPAARQPIPAAHIDRYLTRQLHKMPGFEKVAVSVGYRLRAADEDGCNWSGHVVPMYDTHFSHADSVSRRLRPFIKAAQARFNLSE